MSLTTNYIPRYKGLSGGQNQVQNSTVSDDGTSIDWTTGNVIYTSAATDTALNAVITAATAGDTIILESGTIAATGAINVTKALNIVGQGCGRGTSGTLVSTSTNSIHLFNVTASNVRIANMYLAKSGTGNYFASVLVDGSAGTVLSNVWLENLYILDQVGTAYGIYFKDTSGTIRNVIVEKAGSSSAPIMVANFASAEAATITNIHNCRLFNSSGNTVTGIFSYSSSATQDVTVNLYDSSVIVSGASSVAVNASGGSNAKLNAYNSYLSGVASDATQANSATLTVYNCRLGTGLTSGTITYSSGESNTILIKGRIWYIGIGDSIATAVTNATAGDTLLLASGTYSISTTLVDSKGLNFQGQGIGKTTIALSSAAKLTGVSNTRFSDLSITSSSTATAVIDFDGTAGTIYSGIVLRNLDITASASGAKTGIRFLDSGGTIENVNASITSSDSYALGMSIAGNSTCEAAITANIYSSNLTAISAATAAYGANVSDNSSPSAVTLNIYNSKLSASGAGNRYGVYADLGTDAVANIYNSTLSGTTYDAITANSATLNLSNTVLTNNLSTGCTFVGTVNTKGLYANGRISQQAVALTDAATIATDASLGNFFTVTLGDNRTLGNPTNPVAGQKILYAIRQDGTGSRTLAYGADFRFGTDVTSPTLTTTINKTDYIGFVYNGTDSKWDCIGVAKGY